LVLGITPGAEKRASKHGHTGPSPRMAGGTQEAAQTLEYPFCKGEKGTEQLRKAGTGQMQERESSRRKNS